MTTANKLTILRVLMIPVFLVVLYCCFPGCRYVALGIYIVACLTDLLDGYIARHSKKRIVKSTEMFVMFSSVPSSNIDDLLYLIHSKHSFLSFTTEGTEDTEIL